MSVAVAASASVPTVLEQLVDLLVTPPAAPPPQQRRNLANLLQGMADAIAKIRSEQERLDLTRLQLCSLLQQLHQDLRRTAEVIETLQGHPLLDPLLRGERGILDALGGAEQIERQFQQAAGRAENWRKEMVGPGRHTVADVLGQPRPELMAAAAIVRLSDLLRRPLPTGRHERDCLAVELLWQLSGAPPSNSIGRWKSLIAMAREHKAARAESLLYAWVLVDQWVRQHKPLSEVYAEALRAGNQKPG